MMNKIAELQANYLVYLQGDEDQKRSMQANETMMALMGGKPWPKKEDVDSINFLEKYKNEWEEIQSLNSDMATLTQPNNPN